MARVRVPTNPARGQLSIEIPKALFLPGTNHLYWVVGHESGIRHIGLVIDSSLMAILVPGASLMANVILGSWRHEPGTGACYEYLLKILLYFLQFILNFCLLIFPCQKKRMFDSI